MDNRLFTVQELDIVMDIRRWRYVCPPYICDVEPLCDTDHQAWMLQNTHNHPYKEVLFVLDGNGVFGCDGKVYSAAAGTAFVMESYVGHDLFYPENLPAFEHLWMFVFADSCIYQRVNRQRTGGRSLDKIQLLAHVENSHGAALLYETSVQDSMFKLQTSLSSLLYSVVQEGYVNTELENEVSFQDKVIDAICKHIQDTAGRGATLDTLARISGYSKFHFLRLFKQHTGKSVHEYIDMCRRRRIIQLQAQGLYKKEIAAELGFSCLAAYSRWFKSQAEV